MDGGSSGQVPSLVLEMPQGFKNTELSKFLPSVWGGLPGHLNVQSITWGFKLSPDLEGCAYSALPAPHHPAPHHFTSGQSPLCPANSLGQGLFLSVALRSKLEDDVF